MADPKGPETGQGAKGGHSARPRSPTLDLSATEVPAKAAAPSTNDPLKTGSKPESPKTAEPVSKPTQPEFKPAQPETKPATPEPSKPTVAAQGASVPGASASASASSGKTQSSATSAAGATAAGSKPLDPKLSDTKPSEPKPFDSKPSDPKPADPKPADAAAAKPAGAASPTGPSAGQAARAAAAASTAKTSASSSVPARSGVGPVGVAAAAIGGAAIAVLVIALFGKELMGLGPSDGARVAAAEAKLDAVGRDVAALRSDLANTARSSDTGAIDGRLAELSKTIEASNGRVGGVEGELKALTAKVSEPTPPDPAIAALAGRVEGLELRLQNSPTAEALAGLAGRIEGVEARLGDLPTKQSIAEVNANVSAMGKKVEAATGPLGARIDEVAAALKARPVGDPAARLVVALGALDGALTSGRPFAAEFEAVKAAAGGNGELDAIAPYAAKGLPTREALGAELSATLGKLAPVKSEATGSVLDRLIANAGDVVKITPKDAGGGSDLASARARVAAQGAAGDLEGALAARGGLDEAARAATDDWATRAGALVSAETAIASARTAALARLTAKD